MNVSVINEITNFTNLTGATNAANKETWEPRKPEPDVPSSVVLVLIVIGTIGNLLVCLTIYLDKRLQNVTNFFLLSLAVTDLIINVIVLPARVAIHVYVLQPSDFFWCYLYLVGDDYLTAASALHICFISLGRFFAIKNPLNKRNLTKRRVYIKMLLVWLISFFTIIPYFIIVLISDKPSKPMYCPILLVRMKHKDVVLCVEAIVIFTMMVIVVCSFIGTTILLYRIMEKQKIGEVGKSEGMVRTVGGNRTQNGSKSKLQELNTEKKAMRVVWLISFAFIVVMCPYATVNLIYVLNPEYKIPIFVLRLVAYLAYTNSVINPILYTIFNKKFRKNFKNILMMKYKHV